MTGPLGAVARALVEALSPMQEALQSPAAFEQLLRDLGYEGTVTATALSGLDAAATFADLVPRGTDLIDRLDSLDSGDPDWAGLVQDLVDLGQDLLAAVDALRSVNGAALDPSLADPALWRDLALALPGYLVVQYLEDEVPLVYALLRLTGVITDTGDADAPREVFDSDQLARVAADPVGAVRDLYGWGQPSGFRYGALLDELALALTVLGLEARTGPARPRFATRFFGADTVSTVDGPTELVVPLAAGFIDGAYRETGLVLVAVPPRPGGDIAELFLTNISAGSAVTAYEPAGGWSLRLTGALDATGLIGLRLTPDAARLEDQPPDPHVTWTLSGDPATPWQLLGGLLEIGGVDLALDISGSADSADLVLSVQLRDAAVILGLADGDSFLRSLVGAEPLRVDLSSTVAWSTGDGLTLAGSAGIDVVLPLTLNLGIAVIERLHLLLTGDGAAARIQADVSATAEIGPLLGTVEGIGVAVLLTGRTGGGTLGGLDVGIGFVPPHGIGFAVVSEVATGGGYVEADRDAGRYAGYSMSVCWASG